MVREGGLQLSGLALERARNHGHAPRVKPIDASRRVSCAKCEPREEYGSAYALFLFTYICTDSGVE
jgi:hypothetical protein